MVTAVIELPVGVGMPGISFTLPRLALLSMLKS